MKFIIPLGLIITILLISYLSPYLISQLPHPFQRVFTIFSPSHPYGSGAALINAKWRFKYWQNGLRIISQHPLLGIGFTRVGREYLYLPLAEYVPLIGGAHNIYIATAIMLGIPGLILLIWIFYLHLRRGIILYQQTQDYFLRRFILWLVMMLISHSIIYFFGGGPQDLSQYFFYAGLVNLNWFSMEKE